MMINKNYIPRNAVAFCGWLTKFNAYATANHERWGIRAPDSKMAERIEDLRVKNAKCEEPNHGSLDIYKRNQLRMALEREVRQYIQGLVIRNVDVTEEDRKYAGLPVYDTKPTPIGDPTGLVSATVTYVNEGVLQLLVAHVEGTPFDERANYGVKIAYTVLPFDDPEPMDAALLSRSVFTRRKKERFTFEKHESGKKAWFCLRYENRKGKTGQWGAMIHAVIP